MNVKSLMSSFGTNINRDMEPTKFISAITSCPIVTQKVPELGKMADNVGTLVNGYDKLNNQLETLKSNITKAEDTIDTTQRTINKGQEALSGVLTYTPEIALEAVLDPVTDKIRVIPTGGLAPFQIAITTANNALDKARELLNNLKEQLIQLEKTIEAYYKKMIDTVKGYVTRIADLRIN